MSFPASLHPAACENIVLLSSIVCANLRSVERVCEPGEHLRCVVVIWRFF